MLLSYIQDLVMEKKEYEYSHEIYEVLIEKWLNREASKPGIKEKYNSREEFKEKLRGFSQHLAIILYREWKQGNRANLSIHKDEVISNYKGFQLLDFEDNLTNGLKQSDLRSRSLLNRDADGNYKFSHKSVLEYYLAKEAFDNPAFYEEIDFKGITIAHSFFKELFFKNCLKNCTGTYELQNSAVIKKLNQLKVKELSEISTLKITSTENINLVFLLSIGSNQLKEITIYDTLMFPILYKIYILKIVLVCFIDLHTFQGSHPDLNYRINQIERINLIDLTDLINLINLINRKARINRKDLKDQKDQKDLNYPKFWKDLKDLKDRKDLIDRINRKDLIALKDFKDFKDLIDWIGRLDLKDRKDQIDRINRKVLIAYKDFKDLTYLKDFKDLIDHKDRKDLQDRKDLKYLKDLKDRQDLEYLGYRIDLKDFKDLIDWIDRQDQMDLTSLKDFKDLIALIDHKDLQDRKYLKYLKYLKDRKDLKDSIDRIDLKDLQDPKILSELKLANEFIKNCKKLEKKLPHVNIYY